MHFFERSLGRVLFLGTVLLPVAAACDPCSGIGTCSSPQLRYEGDVLQKYPSLPLEGIRVEFRPTGGVPMKVDVLTAVSNEDGRFLLEGEAETDGAVIGTLTFFATEPIPPAVFPGVALEAVRGRGDRQYAGSWEIPFPHLPYEAHFFDRATRAAADGIEVEFRRTGGIEVDPDTFRATTDVFGNVKLRPLAREAGVVRGELVVYPVPPYRPFTVPDLEMATFYEQRFDSTLVRIGVGADLPYAGTLKWADSMEPAADIRLEFRRSGGVPIRPDPFFHVTDAFGTFHLNPVPLVEGQVQGALFAYVGEGDPQLVAEFTLEAATTNRPPQYLGTFLVEPLDSDERDGAEESPGETDAR